MKSIPTEADGQAGIPAELVTLHEHGCALLLVQTKSKAPCKSDWPNAPLPDLPAIADHLANGGNVGILLGERSLTAGGYVHTIDFDVRAAAKHPEALAALERQIPTYRTLPCIRSGNALGCRGTTLVVLEDPSPKVPLARSATNLPGTLRPEWVIELLGSGQQSVLPPSIHPDSAKPYQWERRFPSMAEIEAGGPLVWPSPDGLMLLNGHEDEEEEDDLYPPPPRLAAPIWPSLSRRWKSSTRTWSTTIGLRL